MGEINVKIVGVKSIISIERKVIQEVLCAIESFQSCI